MVGILGHRGARGLWPENSIQGFRNAIELGVDMVEFDVHLSKDGVPVVIHDHTLERTTTGTGPVALRTAAELSRIRLREAEDEGIATLDEVLDALNDGNVTLVVEIKTAIDAAPYPGIERLVLERLEKHRRLDRAMIISFVPECLERVRAIQPDMPVMACLWRPQAQAAEGLAPAIARLDRIGGVIVAVQEELLTQNEALCRELVPPDRLAVGINNDPDRMRYWIGSSVRHISTDRPDLALAMRGPRGTPGEVFTDH